MKSIGFKKILSSLILVIFVANVFYAQDDDMLKLLDSVEGKNAEHEKVMATFKESRIINLQTIETVKAKTMAFNITHVFGNIGVKSNGGVHTLYGLDNVSDIRFSFDFGITDNLTVGIGRSKQAELLDGLIKYKILSQTLDNHVPFSLAVYGDMSYNPQDKNIFYNGISSTADFKKRNTQRLSYTTELLIARKFGKRLSIELAPTYQHRNYVLANINADNGKPETNDLFAVGAGFRLKLTNRLLIVADYFYNFSQYRRNNPVTPYYNPLAIGFEIETGGHVFHLSFTNTAGIIENNFIPKTTDSWLKGGFKFGFNISRVFNVGPHE